jgi:hypothetical protein
MYSLSLDVVRPGIEYLHRLEDCLEFEIRRTADSLDLRVPDLTWGNGAVFFPCETHVSGVSQRSSKKIA